MSEIISIIIPTYDNPQYLVPCLNSVLKYKLSEGLFHIYVVDNGKIKVADYLPREIALSDDLTVIDPGENLGWEGGLKMGLKYVPNDTQFVMFLNDDTYIPYSSRTWLNRMIQPFKLPEVGAIGPTSNVVMGNQNIFLPITDKLLYTELLIGFCVMYRKSALIKAGGIDDSLPGGDDFDLSIRMVDAGYKMLIDRGTFVYHHGFKTGIRLKGTENVEGGWNSYEMYQRTNTALIKKHGFARFQRFMLAISKIDPFPLPDFSADDVEGKKIVELVGKPKGKIYDLGCGDRITIPGSIGVDLHPKNDFIPTIKKISKATIEADVSKPLPFKDASVIIARHILEHMVNPIDTLRNWSNAMKSGGRIVIAVPNENKTFSIPVNVEHKHAFTPDFLTQILHVTGFEDIKIYDSKNGVSFIISAKKP